MVAEEIHLAPALEEKGIAVFETDLGEFIVQLRKEPPYHIVTPAMHLSRSQIAELFKEKLGGIETDDPEKLVAAARVTLRRAFFTAEMGITGTNFLVADRGLVAITTNEGNADLGVTLPKIHVVIAGIEKVVPRLEDLAILWPVLAGSGTGQPITVYNTLVGGLGARANALGPRNFTSSCSTMDAPTCSPIPNNVKCCTASVVALASTHARCIATLADTHTTPRIKDPSAVCSHRTCAG